MSFLSPLFLLLGLLAIPILLLYMLRLRRRETLVSSTLLWQKLLRDREANAPWQKLRRNLLLLLQLLILAALVLTLARPFIPVATVVSGSVVVLLDGSASMQASDVEPSRFAAAKAKVLELIDALGGNDQMTLIQVSQAPAVLAAATGDRALLRQAVEEAEPSQAAANWAAALALAAGAAQGFRDARIIVVSDGGLPADLPPLAAEVLFTPVGNSDENLALSALATRSAESGPALFASVTNHSSRERRALVSISLDGTLFDSRRVTLAAGGTASLTWQLPADASLIEARLSDHEPDYLALDDVAWAVHEGGASNRTLLVTPGNIFLEQVLAVLPAIELFRAGSTSETAGGEAGRFDLYVYDSTPLPQPLPPADLLIINPQGDNELLSVTGAFSETTVIQLADVPLLQFVNLSAVHIRQAQLVEAPWAQSLVEAEGGPLLLAGEPNGHRVAILSFDLHDSDLPLQIAFPILMANIMGWLTPGRPFDAPGGIQPGDPVSIAPPAGTTAVTILRPGGDEFRVEVGEESILISDTGQPGLYQVRLSDISGERPAGAFAVNLFAPAESAITPAEVIQLGHRSIARASDGYVGQLELWPWLAAAAIVVLVVEWWVYYRGVGTG